MQETMKRRIKSIVIKIIVLLLLIWICPAKQVIPEITYAPYDLTQQVGNTCEAHVVALYEIGTLETAYVSSKNSYHMLSPSSYATEGYYYLARMKDGTIGGIFTDYKTEVSFNPDAANASFSDYVCDTEYAFLHRSSDQTLTLRGMVTEAPQFSSPGYDSYISEYRYGVYTGSETETQRNNRVAFNAMIKDIPFLDCTYQEPKLNMEKQFFRIVCIAAMCILGAMLAYDVSQIALTLWRRKYDPLEEQTKGSICNVDFTKQEVPTGGWRCACGRPHAAYESSCVCGKNKNGKDRSEEKVANAPADQTPSQPSWNPPPASALEEPFTYRVGGVSSTDPWIFILCNEEDPRDTEEPFTYLVKKAAGIFNDGVWEGNILPAGIFAGDTRYRIQNDPLLMVFQYDTLFGIVLEYTPTMGLEVALNYLSNMLDVAVDDQFRPS